MALPRTTALRALALALGMLALILALEAAVIARRPRAPLWTFSPPGALWSASFADGGRAIVLELDGHVLEVRSCETRAVLARLDVGEKERLGAVSPRGDLVLTAPSESCEVSSEAVTLRSIATGARLWSLAAPSRVAETLFSPGGSFWVGDTSVTGFELRDVRDGHRIAALEPPPGEARLLGALRFSPRDDVLVAQSPPVTWRNGPEVKTVVWSLPDGKFRFAIPGEPVGFSARGELLVLDGVSLVARSPVDGARIRTVIRDAAGIGPEPSEDGERAIVRREYSKSGAFFEVLALATGAVVWRVPAPPPAKHGFTQSELSPHGDRALLVDAPKGKPATVELWELPP